MSALPATVLTAVRNGEAYVSDAISSVRAQTFQEFEHVIVDDASEDRTVEIVEAAMREDPRIRLLRRSERGFQATCLNDGLGIARGRYIFNLDADDMAAPERIERQLAFMAANPSLRACAGGTEPLGVLGGNGRRRRAFRAIPVRALRWWLVVRRNLTHSTACIERDAFESIGFYGSERAAQDVRVWCSLARRFWLGICPDTVTYTRRHGGQVSAVMAGVQRESAIDSITDHVKALAGPTWSREDASILYELQKCSATPLVEGLRVLRRWDQLWRSDETLDREDRRVLARLGQTLRVRTIILRRPVARLVCRGGR